MHYFLPEGVQTASTLVTGGAGDGRARARTKQQMGLALCSVTVTALIQLRFDPRLLE